MSQHADPFTRSRSEKHRVFALLHCRPSRDCLSIVSHNEPASKFGTVASWITKSTRFGSRIENGWTVLRLARLPRLIQASLQSKRLAFYAFHLSLSTFRGRRDRPKKRLGCSVGHMKHRIILSGRHPSYHFHSYTRPSLTVQQPPYSYARSAKFAVLRRIWKVAGRSQFPLPLFHLERVHVLDNARDHQRTAFVLNKVEEEQDLLVEWTKWEGEGYVPLSRRSG